MAQTIRLKKSAVPGKAPAVGDLALGELAMNTNDGKLFMLRNNGTPTVVEIGGSVGVSDGDKGDITVSASGATWTIDNGSVTLAKMAQVATASVVYRKTAGAGAPEVQSLSTLKTDLGLTGTNSGDQTITLTGDVTGSGTGSFGATLANSGVTAGSYGSASQVATFTVDSKGRLTGAGSTSISITSGQVSGLAASATTDTTNAGNISSGTLNVSRLPAFSGDATSNAGTSALTLANSGVAAGTYTKVTVDAKGRVTIGGSLTSGDLPTYTGTLSSSQVTTALGFTPSSAPAAVARSANFTATAGVTYLVDTTSGRVDVTLPASPTVGDRITFVDANGNFHVNTLRLLYASPNNIMGLSEAMDINIRHVPVGLIYTATGWRLGA